MISTQAPEYLNKNTFIATASRDLEELFPLNLFCPLRKPLVAADTHLSSF